MLATLRPSLFKGGKRSVDLPAAAPHAVAPMPLTVAIVGRPNVGKSTLFNRLAGKRLAIVDDTPGVTRDRATAPSNLGGLDLKLIDTAVLPSNEAIGEAFLKTGEFYG